MKTCMAIIATTWLLGQTASPLVGPDIAQWLQIPATAAVIGLLIYIIVKHLPRQQASFERVINKVVDSNDANMAKQINAMADLTTAIRNCNLQDT